MLHFMKVSAPALLPLLRSQAQGEILAWVFLTPGEHSIVDIARATNIPETTVLREIDRLTATGFVLERRQGRSRLVTPNPDNPATQPLTALLAITFGPAHVLRQNLASLDGVDYAAIYGSWAARATGAPGQPPADIDLLVVGEPPRTDLYELAEDASTTLRRPVNATVVDRAIWLAGTDPFVATVQQRPLITLIDNLHQAEGITVAGQPSARLVPAALSHWRRSDEIADLFSGPTDPDWQHDRERVGDDLRDPSNKR